MFKVNNKDTRTPHWRRSGVFIVNFEHIFLHLVLVFLLLTLNMKLPAGVSQFIQIHIRIIHIDSEQKRSK